MTVNAQTPISGPYEANGVNRLWDYQFRADELDHLRIEVTDLDGEITTYDSGFTATGLGSQDGGTITFPIAPADPIPLDYTVRVYRAVPYGQPTAIGNQGAFFPEVHEQAMDLLAMQIQQLANQGLQIGSVLTGAPGSPATVEAVIEPLGYVLNFSIPAGAVGPVGATGNTGPEGPEGPQGPQGDPGVGLTVTGVWSAVTAYTAGQVVSHGGGSYAAIVGNTDVEPGVDVGWDTTWLLLAAPGEVQVAGAPTVGRVAYFSSATEIADTGIAYSTLLTTADLNPAQVLLTTDFADNGQVMAQVGGIIGGYYLGDLLDAVFGSTPGNYFVRGAGSWEVTTPAQVAAALPDPTTTTKGTVEFATASEFRAGGDSTRALNTAQMWAAAEHVALTYAATVAVALSAGWHFSLTLTGDAALGAPSALKDGQTGLISVVATGATRNLTLNAAWILDADEEVGPYAITTAEELVIGYNVRGSRVRVTGIKRYAL